MSDHLALATTLHLMGWLFVGIRGTVVGQLCTHDTDSFPRAANDALD